MRWHLASNGQKILEFQEFADDRELFDAAAVYALIAARMSSRKPGSEFGNDSRKFADHYDTLLEKNPDKLGLLHELGIKSAFDRARYAERLVNAAFR